MWKNLPYKSFVYFSLTLNLILEILIFVVKSHLPPLVPLLYGLPSGVEQLTPTDLLFVVPISGIVITIINVLASNLTKDLFLKKILIISSSFVSLLLSITVVKIILLVGFF